MSPVAYMHMILRVQAYFAAQRCTKERIGSVNSSAVTVTQSLRCRSGWMLPLMQMKCLRTHASYLSHQTCKPLILVLLSMMPS